MEDPTRKEEAVVVFISFVLLSIFLCSIFYAVGRKTGTSIGINKGINQQKEISIENGFFQYQSNIYKVKEYTNIHK